LQGMGVAPLGRGRQHHRAYANESSRLVFKALR